MWHSQGSVSNCTYVNQSIIDLFSSKVTASVPSEVAMFNSQLPLMECKDPSWAHVQFALRTRQSHKCKKIKQEDLDFSKEGFFFWTGTQVCTDTSNTRFYSRT